ncbi:unnamed protein product [Orchesella dallaii]|uniref:Uncharacterized protein n=1 Tax=Orchesella dallaii TaxID=48710 RepID=A0ABP1QJK2_9HEXA
MCDRDTTKRCGATPSTSGAKRTKDDPIQALVKYDTRLETDRHIATTNSLIALEDCLKSKSGKIPTPILLGHVNMIRENVWNSPEYWLPRGIPIIRLGIIGDCDSKRNDLLKSFLGSGYVTLNENIGCRTKFVLTLFDTTFLIILREETAVPSQEFVLWVDSLIFVANSSYGTTVCEKYIAKWKKIRSLKQINLVAASIKSTKVQSMAFQDRFRCVYPDAPHFEVNLMTNFNVREVFVAACEGFVTKRTAAISTPNTSTTPTHRMTSELAESLKTTATKSNSRTHIPVQTTKINNFQTPIEPKRSFTVESVKTSTGNGDSQKPNPEPDSRITTRSVSRTQKVELCTPGIPLPKDSDKTIPPEAKHSVAGVKVKVQDSDKTIPPEAKHSVAGVKVKVQDSDKTIPPEAKHSVAGVKVKVQDSDKTIPPEAKHSVAGVKVKVQDSDKTIPPEAKHSVAGVKVKVQDSSAPRKAHLSTPVVAIPKDSDKTIPPEAKHSVAGVKVKVQDSSAPRKAHLSTPVVAIPKDSDKTIPPEAKHSVAGVKVKVQDSLEGRPKSVRFDSTLANTADTDVEAQKATCSGTAIESRRARKVTFQSPTEIAPATEVEDPSQVHRPYSRKGKLTLQAQMTGRVPAILEVENEITPRAKTPKKPSTRSASKTWVEKSPHTTILIDSEEEQ